MENLYKSLYDDLNENNDTCTNLNFEVNIIDKISGQHDINCLSKYYNFEEYSADTETLGNNYINIIHINIRSLHKNFDLLKSFLNCLPKLPDVIAVTETWLQETTKHLYSLDGYTSIHLTRTNKEHGGISIFTRNEIKVDVLHQFHYVDDNIEICSCKLEIENTNYVISVLYRPRSKHIAVNEFTNILNEILTNEIFRRNKTVLVGDFNINLLEHSTHLPTNIFLNTMQTLNYFPHISRPTRFPDSPNLSQPSLLDHIWTNFTPFSFSGIIHCCISDHLPIFININQQTVSNPKHKISFRNFNPSNQNLFTEELQKKNWQEILCLPNTNDNFNLFINALFALYNKCFPIKIKYVTTKRLNNPWLTKGILNSIKQKAKLFKRYKLGIITHNHFKQYRNTLTQVIRFAKINYYRQIFSNFRNNTKKIWQTINELKGNTYNKNSINTLHYKDSILSNPLEISEAFSSYFSNIAPELDSKLPQSNKNPKDYLKGNYPNSMVLPILSTQDIKTVIKSLKNKNSGLQDIAISVIKRNSELFSIPLTILFNKSVETGTFPALLKIAKITPIHKSGPDNVPKNFRPISQLSVFSKIFETLMKTHLMQYLENRNILNDAQFGFRRNRNTFQALNIFSTDVFTAIDNKLSVLSIFIDFAKAFDTVNHKILLEKMHHYGIRGQILSWFEDYLTNRQQYTVLNGEKSHNTPVTLGVPQGSVLGPILFLLYINDITDIFSRSKTILFADDMTMYLTGPYPEQLVHYANNELEKLHQWCLCNRLTINTKKTQFMLFTIKSMTNLPQLQLNKNVIFQTDQIKFLGVTYDESLTFKHHISNLTLKISRLIALLFQIKDFMPLDVLRCIYYAHVYPLLTYCNPIWCTTYSTYLIPLKLQLKKIVRIITNSGYLDHTPELFKQTGMLKLDDITNFTIATFMYKNKNDHHSLLPTHSYNTRHRHNLSLPSHRLTKFQHSMTYLGPVVWNTIPSHIQDSQSLSIFKKQFKKHILNNY